MKITKQQLRDLQSHKGGFDTDSGKYFDGFRGTKNLEDGLWHGDCHLEDATPYLNAGHELAEFSISEVLGGQQVDVVGEAVSDEPPSIDLQGKSPTEYDYDNDQSSAASTDEEEDTSVATDSGESDGDSDDSSSETLSSG